jgi:transposase
MSLELDQLPDDPMLLKQMLAQERAARVAQIEQIRQEAAQQLEVQRLRLEAQKKAAVEAILRRFYGPRSERFDPTQLLLFGIAIDSMPVDAQAVEQESGQTRTTRRVRHKHGRQKLPECLERIKIEHKLEGQKLACPCCGKERACIGQEVTEQLEHFPASFKVLQHVQYKYACRDCDQVGHHPQIELAEKPPQPIDKGLAAPGLLAYVITSKLADHLPLYRLEKIFQRHDLHIASSTMCAWMGSCAELATPLYRLLIDRVRQSRAIHTDDTRVPVQDASVKGKCKSGRIWTYIGDAQHPYIVYEYTPDRTRAGPAAWLKDYQGYLQADAYGGYDGVYATGVIEVACWAHARRKFFDAKETDGARAAAMLAMVRELYAVEDEAKALSDDARRELRQSKSASILARIKGWLDEQQNLVLPRSPMAGAIQYTLNQWQALCRYCEQGWLDIDNNAAERALKRVAIGRKNWLFAGNDTFGQHHAVLWSLIASAEAHGLDPQRYLRSVLAKIGQTPLSDLGQFLPEVWRAEDAAGAAVKPPAVAPGSVAAPSAARELRTGTSGELRLGADRHSRRTHSRAASRAQK